jgi:hypothetical protein
MVDAAELLHLSVFANLPEDQISWFISQSQELTLKPDETSRAPGIGTPPEESRPPMKRCRQISSRKADPVLNGERKFTRQLLDEYREFSGGEFLVLICPGSICCCTSG